MIQCLLRRQPPGRIKSQQLVHQIHAVLVEAISSLKEKTARRIAHVSAPILQRDSTTRVRWVSFRELLSIPDPEARHDCRVPGTWERTVLLSPSECLYDISRSISANRITSLVPDHLPSNCWKWSVRPRQPGFTIYNHYRAVLDCRFATDMQHLGTRIFKVYGNPQPTT